MIKNAFFDRNILKNLYEAIKRSPVVLITGARQSGKTTLVQMLCEKNNYTYITFDDLRYLDRAKNDPIGFIENIQTPIILDEVQRVPEIFLTIKRMVDQKKHPGMFILTGSADPMLLPRLGDSLAGRMEILPMYPLSQSEILGKEESFIDTVFNKNLSTIKCDVVSLKELCKKIYVGGYPSVQNLNEKDLYAWFNSYLTTILQRDVKDLANIEGIEQLPNLLYLIASRTGGLLNISELSRSCNIPYVTLNRYLILLKTIFLTVYLRPWYKNMGKRLVKSPKIYLQDTGLLLFLLQSDSEKLISDPKFFGPIFENFVLSEILKQSSWSNYFIELYHYRTVSGVEVDAVLQNNKGKVVGIEIKSGQYIQSSDFKGLKHLETEFGDNFVNGIVIYPGNEIISFGKNLWALPVSSLWC